MIKTVLIKTLYIYELRATEPHGTGSRSEVLVTYNLAWLVIIVLMRRACHRRVSLNPLLLYVRHIDLILLRYNCRGTILLAKWFWHQFITANIIVIHDNRNRLINKRETDSEVDLFVTLVMGYHRKWELEQRSSYVYRWWSVKKCRAESEIHSRTISVRRSDVGDNRELSSWCVWRSSLNHGRRSREATHRHDDGVHFQRLQVLDDVTRTGRHVARDLGDTWRHVIVRPTVRRTLCTSKSSSSSLVTSPLRRCQQHCKRLNIIITKSRNVSWNFISERL